jgi:hypothetical protein
MMPPVCSIKTAAFFLIFLCAAISCSRSRAVAGKSGVLELQIPADGTGEAESADGAGYVPADAQIAVLFGYGYNDAAFQDAVIPRLKRAFGLADEAGLILPLVYPDDFRYGDSGRISDLYGALKSRRIRGLILLGAPERTHAVLARLRDDHAAPAPETVGGYPIFSLFPQDDVLGTEAGADVVLDFAAAFKDADAGETLKIDAQRFAEEVPEILAKAVRYIYALPEPPQPDANLAAGVSRMLGGEWNVLPYIDAETGMHPANHFVVERVANG